MATPSENYELAAENVTAARSQVEAYVHTIQVAAPMLTDWRKVSISGTVGGFPLEHSTLYAALSIDGHQWPSAQQLSDALQHYHLAAKQLRKMWDFIPTSERSGLRPPEKYL